MSRLPAQLRLRLYVAVLVLFPFVAIIFTLWWMTTASYLRHAQYAYFVGTGYGSKLRGADCQVVVDGDSTALVGVLPEVIEQRTGLKTCNIAEVAGVKVVNGMMVLDDYLRTTAGRAFCCFCMRPRTLPRQRSGPRSRISRASFTVSGSTPTRRSGGKPYASRT